MMTVGEVRQWGIDSLKKGQFDDPGIEVDALLSDILNLGITELTLKRSESIVSDKAEVFKSAIKKRLDKKPVAYILGKKNFCGFDFKVDERVLIPRPETEILVEQIAQNISKDTRRILDLGTGSGCISVALAKKLPQVEMTAIDVSKDALAVAKENTIQLGVNDRISFKQSDLYSVLGPEYHGYFDIIVSNPPYISSAEYPKLASELSFEPQLALEAGPMGLDVIVPLVENAPRFLKSTGELWIEIGWDQQDFVTDLMKTNNFKKIDAIKDYAGHPRIVKGKINGSI